ncbi:MAG TPA: VanZ family protein [Patescibacteria group bacterium]|nr:VanZ family protein [Patescibacteria group bacterium]
MRNPVAEGADGRLLFPEKDRNAASGRPTTALDSPMAANNQTVGLDLRARSLWLVLGWVLVLCIVFLSVAPISIETGVEQGDKLSHAFAYGTLMVWFANLYGRLTRRRMFAVGFVALGVALECIQGWTGYRTFEVADIVADAAGVAAGWAFAPPRMPNVLKGVERFFRT